MACEFRRSVHLIILISSFLIRASISPRNWFCLNLNLPMMVKWRVLVRTESSSLKNVIILSLQLVVWKLGSKVVICFRTFWTNLSTTQAISLCMRITCMSYLSSTVVPSKHQSLRNSKLRLKLILLLDRVPQHMILMLRSITQRTNLSQIITLIEFLIKSMKLATSIINAFWNS